MCNYEVPSPGYVKISKFSLLQLQFAGNKDCAKQCSFYVIFINSYDLDISMDYNLKACGPFFNRFSRVGISIKFQK
jgi:hypothetical protein